MNADAASSMPSNREIRLPTGTVTFLFTDIEGSTHLVSTLGDSYAALLTAHNRVLRDAIVRYRGTEISTEGDAFFAAFPSALDAVAAAAEAQRALVATPWPEESSVSVRMGLHSGEGRLGGDNYVGVDVNRAARIAAVAHGGQVLLSDATRGLVAGGLRAGLGIRDLGEHRLRDLPAPERIWQLDIDGLEQVFPALRSLEARPGNLPQPATSLVGREKEVTTVAELLRQRRLVTLTGPGGTGKTRLAQEVAHRLLGDFDDGAFFVDLQDTRGRTAVASAIASALGVREKADRDLEQGAKAHLRERALLLVLDNFEQVVAVAAPLVAELLSESPRVRIIVTSRAVLHLSGEQEFSVPPLSVPDPHGLREAAALSQYEAVALFIDRARAIKSDFEVTDENAQAVAEISSRLDGLPLAIELAAARIKVLDADAILDRLRRRLPVLASGPRDLPARQRTLHGAIGWSYELLDPPEQRLFVRLAVFAGGWTLESAGEVCNPEAELGIETLDGLASLVDNSLIYPSPVIDGESRFGMLQVIREFASEKLDQGRDAGLMGKRHARHLLALAETAEPELRRSDLRRWQHRLRREEENLRSALRRAVDGGDVEIGLRTAGAVWDFWHYWAQLREGVAWLESLLALPTARAGSRARAKAVTGLAGLLYWQGDTDRSWALYEDALATYRQLGDEREIAAALLNSAWAAAARRDLAAAQERADEALERHRRTGDAANSTLVTAWLAFQTVILGPGGDPDGALAAASQALEVSRKLGRAHEAAEWITARALIYLLVGDHARAILEARKALTTWYELGNLGRLPLWFKLLATLELAAGHPARAVRLGAAAERYGEEIGGDLTEAFATMGDPVEEARPLLEQTEHARAVEEGRGMSLEERIGYALAPEAGNETGLG
jgi:predicted ATPase/class 3 adenylate cyclase